jgi:hypothetical protein
MVNPVIPTTFADETNAITPPDDPTGSVMVRRGSPRFLAQVDRQSDVRWLQELRKRLGVQELKWKGWESWYFRIDPGLQAAFTRSLKFAAIFIADYSPLILEEWRFFARDLNSNTLLDPGFRRLFNWLAYRRIVQEGAQTRAAAILESWDPLAAGSLSAPFETPVDPEMVFSLHLARPSNRFRRMNFQCAVEYVVRSHAAFSSSIDNKRYFERWRQQNSGQRTELQGPDRAGRDLLIEDLGFNRHFDEGNQKVTDELRSVRSDVHSILQRYASDDSSVHLGLTSELPSHEQDLLQFADLAAGYASHLWTRKGIEGLHDAYGKVFLNGKRIR